MLKRYNQGSSLIENGIILAIIAIAGVGALTVLGGNVHTMIQKSSDSYQGFMPFAGASTSPTEDSVAGSDEQSGDDGQLGSGGPPAGSQPGGGTDTITDDDELGGLANGDEIGDDIGQNGGGNSNIPGIKPGGQPGGGGSGVNEDDTGAYAVNPDSASGSTIFVGDDQPGSGNSVNLGQPNVPDNIVPPGGDIPKNDSVTTAGGLQPGVGGPGPAYQAH